MSIIKAKVLAFWLPFYKEAIFYFETQIQVPDGSWQHVSFEVNWLGFKTRSYSTDVIKSSLLRLVIQQIDTTHCVSELKNVARRVTGSAFLAVKLIAVVTMRPVTS